MKVSDVRLRLRALVLRGRTERELLDELDFHLEMERRKLRGAGLSEQEADRRARARFGSTALIADQCRDARGITLFETILQDLRYAFRSCRRSPAFALTITLTIGLGLGVNTAVFTIFNAYVLRPLSVQDPQSLYAFAWTTRTGFGPSFRWSEFQDLREEQHVFSDVMATRQIVTRLGDQPALGQLVTLDYFEMLGVEPAAGHTFVAHGASIEDDVIVLSHEAWRRRFASDPDIVGKTTRACSRS